MEQTITAKEIHADFKAAEERLLQEAKDLISNPKVDKILLAERYTKVGFTRCRVVQDAEDITSKQMKSKELIAAVEYFRVYYPNQKFITEKEVEVLCKKYSLVLGDSGWYEGEIPEKNLREIENFILRKEDWKEKMSFWGNALGSFRFTFESGLLTPVIEEKKEAGDSKEYFQPEFKICAPKKDFDQDAISDQVFDGYKLSPKDPIVLQPVSKEGIEGYLIVTAWGDEASDENVVNEIKN